MQGLILAAGMGKRLKGLTKDNTKCMVKVNGITLIERMLHQLDRLDLSKIIIVVGYERQKLIEYIQTLSIHTPIEFIENPVYDHTNNIYSLSLGKEFLLKEDTLLLESDLIFEDSVLDMLLSDPRDTLALVDKYESWMDGTCVKMGEDDTIDSFVPGKKFVYEDIRNYYKTVNIYKFSKQFSEKYYVPFLEAYSKALGNNEYYEQVLRVITMLDKPVIKAKKLTGQIWYEIDDIQDLDIASSMFVEDENEKVKCIQKRYGGYWRYPKILNFSHPVNPYFPPQKLMDEIVASFPTLLTQYPSGLDVNSLLAAKKFGVSIENIVIGNGTGELVKCLMEKLDGTIGLVLTSYEEFYNRYDKDSIIYRPREFDLAYTAKDLIEYYDDKDIRTLILSNPDTCSGNYICKQDLLKLICWCKNRDILIIIDQSFSDYADEEDNSLIEEEIVSEYDNLVIIKSISESNGISGIRLGIMYSGNQSLIQYMKKVISVWNINSFSEFYMQIEEKYKVQYQDALVKVKQERAKMEKELSNLSYLQAMHSQSNCIMLKINDISSKELTKYLLVEKNILVKDLSTQRRITDGQFIRIAIRTEKENQKLLQVLAELENKSKKNIAAH